MLYRALDVIFQHLFRLLAVLLVVPLAAGGVGLALDHAATVEVRIWADKPIFTPEFATDRFTSGDSPADIESGILRELIGTSQFTTEVLTAVDFSYPNWSTDQQTSAEADLQTNVTVTTEGSHLFTLDYRTTNTARGRQIVNAIIAAFGRQVQALDTTQVSVTQTALQGQVDAAYRDMNDAVQAAQTYFAQHQSVQNDPSYQTLVAQAQSRTDSYLAAQAQLDEARGADHAGARVRAMELLGKWRGMFHDNVTVTTNLPVSALLSVVAKTHPDLAAKLATLLGAEDSTEPASAK